MQEKYTENIDNLDSFYKNALEQASVDPPADMWDRINTAYSEQKKPKGFFTWKRSLLLLLLFFLISATGILLILKSNSDETIKTPEVKQETESTQDAKQNTNEVIENTKQETQNTKNAKEREGNTKQETQNTKQESGDNSPVVTETPPPVIVEDTKTKVNTSSSQKETPKKKMNFREKHTQNIKSDSLRPLFVPVK